MAKKKNFEKKTLIVSFSILIAALVLLVVGLNFFFSPSDSGADQNNEVQSFRYSNSSVMLAVVGDCNGYNLLKSGSGDIDPLLSVRPMINQSDVFVFNMEGVILRSDQLHSAVKYPNQSSFISPPVFAKYMKSENITVANLANNHILDGGATGIEETKNSLDKSGIMFLGAGSNAAEACQPLILTVKGTRIGFLSYDLINPSVFSAGRDTPGAGSFLICNVTKSIRYLKEKSDIVVVFLHWGEPWSDSIDDYQMTIARQLSDTGADLVIGHHSHMLQGIGRYNNTLVFYGLGNFLLNTDYEMPPDSRKSMIAFIEIRDQKVQGCYLYPVVLDNNGFPQPAPGNERDNILLHLENLSEPYRTKIINENGTGVIRNISF
ncbi:MAG TPA: CapA family protein [Methanoregulaceae archaeon]|nr:CapA family protein [Methanoregulaceae archaeon]